MKGFDKCIRRPGDIGRKVIVRKVMECMKWGLDMSTPIKVVTKEGVFYI